MKSGLTIISIIILGFACESSQKVIVAQENISETESINVPSDTIKIGSQVWQIKNLDVLTFRNGDTLLWAKSNEEWVNAAKNKIPAWCYLDNDPQNAEFGKLYNYYAVTDPRGLAPKGWRVPTKDDFEVLENTIGSSSADQLKSTEGWENGGSGSNSSGFNALPGGYRNATGLFNPKGRLGAWWSISEEHSGSAWGFALIAADNEIQRKDYYKRSGLSVRCIR